MKTRTLLTALASTALIAGSVSAATLTADSKTLLNASTEAFGVSVVDGEAQVRTGASQGGNFIQLGDGTLLDWRIETGVNGVDPWTGTAPISSGGGTYFDAPVANEVVYTPQNWMKVYTASDITADTTAFANAEIQSGTIPMIASPAVPLVGNIDISNLSDGTFYAIFGGYRSNSSITVTMSGAGQTDIVATNSQSGSGFDNQANLYEFSFDNSDGLYDNIEYSVETSGNGGRRRYGGVLLDGTVIPEPGSLALLGLGGLLIARRRRG